MQEWKKNIRQVVPYVPGEQPKEANVIKLNTNENPYPPSPKVKELRARLYDLEQSKAHDAEAELRKSQIGTGDRAEKIRTYNFPQGRVTDHRIKLTLHRLDDILNGDLDEIIDSLTAADQAAKLSKLQEMER